eukprot:694455-Pleurochrysis_carterae.AAC.3
MAATESDPASLSALTAPALLLLLIGHLLLIGRTTLISRRASPIIRSRSTDATVVSRSTSSAASVGSSTETTALAALEALLEERGVVISDRIGETRGQLLLRFLRARGMRVGSAADMLQQDVEYSVA